ncbi:hypothetical protein RRG08_002572 [Elysia crispata]|uniref:Uncharacterized protein n=1 Tax=Elysia crispata TaxID=231223 RepID=A0AAE0Y5P3_9GAST|nr:hypothetical protein RRG08_002572 [Elysia crispata]
MLSRGTVKLVYDVLKVGTCIISLLTSSGNIKVIDKICSSAKDAVCGDVMASGVAASDDATPEDVDERV